MRGRAARRRGAREVSPAATRPWLTALSAGLILALFAVLAGCGSSQDATTTTSRTVPALSERATGIADNGFVIYPGQLRVYERSGRFEARALVTNTGSARRARFLLTVEPVAGDPRVLSAAPVRIGQRRRVQVVLHGAGAYQRPPWHVTFDAQVLP